MNAEQKQRATELVIEWNTHYPEYVGDRMAVLLQELVEAPEVEPDYWSRGHYCEGSKPHINPLEVWKLPVGTKLYTSPQPQKLSDERILEIIRKTDSGRRPWGIGSTEEDAVEFARAIERELLGE